jgi:hypothetical protein
MRFIFIQPESKDLTDNENDTDVFQTYSGELWRWTELRYLIKSIKDLFRTEYTKFWG